MGFKLSELFAIAIAVVCMILVGVLIVAPGALPALLNLALQKDVAPYVFGAAAVLVFAVLALRLYRRIRPRDPKAAPGFFDLWRWPPR